MKADTINKMAAERRRKIRREIDLDREELFFLLESYRNMIELNTTLLERQDVLNAGIERILGEAVKICSSQNAIADKLGKIPEEIRDLIDVLCAATVGRYDDLKKEIADNRQHENDEHHGHTLRIYAAFGFLTTIVLGLIGLVAKLWP